jgi:hypothetical protein
VIVDNLEIAGSSRCSKRLVPIARITIDITFEQAFETVPMRAAEILARAILCKKWNQKKVI